MIALLEFIEHNIDLVGVISAIVIILTFGESFISTCDKLINRFGITTQKAQKQKEKDARDENMAKAVENLTSMFVELKTEVQKSNEQSERRYNELNDKIDKLDIRQRTIEEDTNELKRKELREKLLQAYSHYKRVGSWNELEAYTFWELFDEYDKRNGNGKMHTEVKPFMEQLPIIDMTEI